MKLVIAYAVAAAAFLVADLVWIGFVARDFYRAQLGALMADQINIGAALAFYLIYILGIVVFAVQPALAAGSWMQALFTGMLLGLVCYATFDLTGLATIKGFPLQMALVDMAWGAVLTGIAAALATMAAMRFGD